MYKTIHLIEYIK